MRGDLADVAVVLQEGAADVQRDVGAVDHALEEHEEFGNDFLDVIRHEHLTGEQLDLTFAGAEILLQLGEVQDALEVEGIIDVEMDPEQRIVKVGEHAVVERLVLLVRALAGVLQPQGRNVVDMRRLGHLDDLFGLLGAVLVGFALDGHVALEGLGGRILEIHGRVHVAAVALEHLAGAVGFEELLVLLGDVQDDGRAVRGAGACAHLEGHAVLARPMDGFGALLPAEGLDFNPVGHHKHGVEAQTEVADDAALVVFLAAVIILEELLGAGESDLIDISLHLVGGHADAGIGDANLLVLLVHGHGNGHRLLRAGVEHAELGDGVAAVAHDLAQEDILIRIQPALDNGHNILRVDRYAAFFHVHSHNVCLLDIT